jgi:CRISPR-associated protein (TIGR03984 family)
MTEANQVRPLIWSGTCKSRADLLEIAGKHASGIVGFFYAPSIAARFFRLDASGRALDQDGKPLAIDGAYEVRLFDDKRDIRGRRNGDRWRVAIVSDGSVAGATSDALAGAVGLTASADPPDCDTRDHQYLLWGRKGRSDAQRNGWTKLTTARIGALWAPHTLENGCDGIAVSAREYFRKLDDGNVVPAGERLTGLHGIRRGDAPMKEEAAHAG